MGLENQAVAGSKAIEAGRAVLSWLVIWICLPGAQKQKRIHQVGEKHKEN